MAEPFGRNVRVPKLDASRAAVVINDLPEIPISSAPADFFASMAGKFGDFATMARKVKAKEDTIAGAQAGLDPDYAPNPNRSDEFNAAANRTYLARMQTEMRQTMGEAARELGANPGALAERFAALRQGYAPQFPGELRPDFELTFGNLSTSLLERSRDAAERAQREEQSVALDAMLSSRGSAMEEIAFAAPDDAQAAARITTELQQARKELIGYGPRGEFELDGEVIAEDLSRAGLLSPAEIQAKTQDMANRARDARVIGQFRQLDGWREKRRFVQAFRDSFEGSGFSLEEHERLARQIAYEADQERALDRMAEERAERLERQAGARLEAAQKGAYSGFLAGILKGEVGEEQIASALDGREIDGAQAERLLRVMRQQGRRAKPDPEVAAAVTTSAAKGESDAADQIAAAVAAGEIDETTAIEAMAAATEAQAADPAVRDGAAQIEQATAEMPPEKRQQAIREYRRRLAMDAEADPASVAGEVIETTRPKPELPRYLQGTIEQPDLAGSKAAIIKAVEAGQLSPDQAELEIRKIIAVIEGRS